MRIALLRGLVGLALALAGCESDHECGAGKVLAAKAPPGPAAASAWTVQHAETQGALVSVWGSGPTDVWAAGGRAGRGLVLHDDGNGWQPVVTGARSFLWWIYGLSATDVYAVGDGGLILHYDGKAWAEVASGTSAALFGVWAGAGNDVWVVGGNPHGVAGEATLLRGNAKGFEPVKVSSHLLPNTLYKVYGSPATTANPAGGIVAVGAAGTVLRYDGTWKRDAVPTDSRIISLWGAGGDDLFAVGGEANGIVLHFDGTTWRKVDGVQAGLELYGVFKAPGEAMVAVGAGPRIVELHENGDLPEGGGRGIGPAGHAAPVESEAPGDIDPATVLHSVWGDGQGTVYAVGGTLFADPGHMTGVVLRRAAVAP